jgi:hypothetical protein
MNPDQYRLIGSAIPLRRFSSALRSSCAGSGWDVLLRPTYPPVSLLSPSESDRT